MGARGATASEAPAGTRYTSKSLETTVHAGASSFRYASKKASTFIPMRGMTVVISRFQYQIPSSQNSRWSVPSSFTSMTRASLPAYTAGMPGTTLWVHAVDRLRDAYLLNGTFRNVSSTKKSCMRTAACSRSSTTRVNRMCFSIGVAVYLAEDW